MRKLQYSVLRISPADKSPGGTRLDSNGFQYVSYCVNNQWIEDATKISRKITWELGLFISCWVRLIQRYCLEVYPFWPVTVLVPQKLTSALREGTVLESGTGNSGCWQEESWAKATRIWETEANVVLAGDMEREIGWSQLVGTRDRDARIGVKVFEDGSHYSSHWSKIFVYDKITIFPTN